MRLYLSGKITGNESYKFDFTAGRVKLEGAGYEVCDPASLDIPEDAPWEEAMKHCLRELLKCDGVAQLPNWLDSKGAIIEARLAKDLGMMTALVSAWAKGGVMRPHGTSGS